MLRLYPCAFGLVKGVPWGLGTLTFLSLCLAVQYALFVPEEFEEEHLYFGPKVTDPAAEKDTRLAHFADPWAATTTERPEVHKVIAELQPVRVRCVFFYEGYFACDFLELSELQCYALTSRKLERVYESVSRLHLLVCKHFMEHLSFPHNFFTTDNSWDMKFGNDIRLHRPGNLVESTNGFIGIFSCKN